MFGCSLFGAGVSNLKPRDQNQPSKDSSRAHWTAMENVKAGTGKKAFCNLFLLFIKAAFL